MTNITLLGSGFAALTAIRLLRRDRVAADITVISPRASLHYLPSVIWLPPHLRSAEDLEIPLQPFFARHRVAYINAAVTGLSEGGRTVETADGSHHNDHLVIATGGHFLRKLPGIEHALIPCAGLDVGIEIARRLDALTGGTLAFGFGATPQEPGAVRGGPMFEFLFIIDTLLRRQGRRERFKLVFFHASNRPGSRLGEKAVDGLLAEMRRRDIDIRLGAKPLRFEPDKVVTEGGDFAADMILFLPGITGPDWLANTGLPLSPGGMVRADATCRVEGFTDVWPNVWVAGDVGSYPGPDWMPKQAHQADLQARTVARNLRDTLAGRRAQHRFRPELICIVDMLDAGSMVYRSQHLNITVPKMSLFHGLKRRFESQYLRVYR